MERHNYGVALSSNGEFQTIDTAVGPGISDSYSRMRSEPFTFFIAPHKWIDEKLNIHRLQGEDYLTARRNIVAEGVRLKVLILRYHGAAEITPKPSWSEGFNRQETNWVYNEECRNRK